MSYDGLGLGAGGPAPQDPESMKGAPGKLMKVPTPKSTPDRKKQCQLNLERCLCINLHLQTFNNN